MSGLVALSVSYAATLSLLFYGHAFLMLTSLFLRDKSSEVYDYQLKSSS